MKKKIELHVNGPFLFVNNHSIGVSLIPTLYCVNEKKNANLFGLVNEKIVFKSH